ncbi:MAG: HD domain-containing protein, partial [Pseudoxanthomonas sp.]
MRAAIADAAQLPGLESAMPDAWPVLADTLEALVALSAEGDVLVAALLFGIPGLQAGLKTQLAKQSGIAGLVDGQNAAAQVWALHAERLVAGNSEGLRRLLLSIVHDLRVVPILLARQLARMRAAGKLPAADRRLLAQLTRDIHAPLANRLGIWQLKWELEDLSFRYLEPETYRQLVQQLDEKRAGRERYIEGVKT